MEFAPAHPLHEIEGYRTLKLSGFEIIGRSIAGVETVLSIPQWHVSFDTGRAPAFAFARDVLALTHCHLDHAGGLPGYLGLRALQGMQPLKIVVPPQKVQAVSDYLKALEVLSETRIVYEILVADKPIELCRGLTLRAVPSFHCVASQGYVVEEEKKQLRPEFKGKTQAEIVAAKAAGIQINDYVCEVRLAVSGDTRGEFLATQAAGAEVLVMECSFFDDGESYEAIRRFGHTHILDWRRHADKVTAKTVVMIHTSLRFEPAEIVAACQKHLPESILKRLIIFR